MKMNKMMMKENMMKTRRRQRAGISCRVLEKGVEEKERERRWRRRSTISERGRKGDKSESEGRTAQKGVGG